MVVTDQVDELVARHGAMLLALAHTISNDWAEAEDIVQATYEIALRNLHRLREPAAARAWLLRIESREAFRIQRRMRRFVSLEFHVQEKGDIGGAEGGASADESVDVRRAIAGLPPRTRAALMLHHYCGLSVEETAAALGVSPNTVKTQLRKGLSRVREELR
jgi:RNA polymerase sigma factor (sigma-70 family)